MNRTKEFLTQKNKNLSLSLILNSLSDYMYTLALSQTMACYSALSIYYIYYFATVPFSTLSSSYSFVPYFLLPHHLLNHQCYCFRVRVFFSALSADPLKIFVNFEDLKKKLLIFIYFFLVFFILQVWGMRLVFLSFFLGPCFHALFFVFICLIFMLDFEL